MLRSRNFRLLWLSQSVSVLGDALVVVAIGLYVTRLTGRASDVGLVLAAYTAPLLVFLLIGGVMADRLPRQLVMVSSDLVRAGLHGVLALLIVTGLVQIWQMAVIGLLYGTAEAFFRPAYTGLIPQTVDENEIQSAQALTGLSAEIAEFASPALATALVLGVNPAAAFAVDASTFLVSAALVVRVRPRPRGAAGVRGTVLTELREGWTAVRERTWVWCTVAAFCTALLVALAPFFVLGAGVARQVYGTEAVFGLANAAFGVGTITGAFVGSRWRPRRPMLLGLSASVWWPAAIALYAAGPPRPVMYAGMVGGGLGIGGFAVWWETALAQRIPPHLLSRVSAWDWMGSTALLPLGFILSGPVADRLGRVPVLIVGGLLGTLACTAALIPGSTRALRRLDDEPGPETMDVPTPTGGGVGTS